MLCLYYRLPDIRLLFSRLAPCCLKLGCNRRFRGINDFKMLNPTLPQFPPHDLCQRTDRGLTDICDPESSRIKLVPCTHRADHGCARFLCLADQLQLPGHCVNGIDHIIVGGKVKLARCLRQIKRAVYIHARFRINFQNALPRSVDLVLSNRPMRCNDLAVQIGQTDLVAVNQVQLSDSASRQCLNDISSDPANAKYRHTAMRERFYARAPQQ